MVIFARDLSRIAPHFKQSCAPILQSETVPLLPLNEVLGKELFEGKAHERPKFDAQALRKYLIEIGFGKEVAKADSLSRQEKACLRELIQWRSAKETAATLDLSPRTVEHYLDNIKSKFNCLYKRDLFPIAEKMHALGLI